MIFVHAVVLVVLSLALALLTPGMVYLAFAAGGGALFMLRAWQLVLEPTRARAMRCFFASLIQLSLVLLGVMLDAGVRLTAGAS
ncbi:MAG: hypothetical protein R3E48_09795 [Burkholderiaceae bacterium]